MNTKEKKSQSDNTLKPARQVKEYTVSARLRAAAPSARIGLLLRYNVCNVLFWLQIRHQHTLIMPIINPTIWGGAKEIILMIEISFTRTKSDVRQGTTDQGSASIANLVAAEDQRLQHLVLAANQTHTRLDNAPLSIKKKKIGWRQRIFLINELSFK
jgi:hypothetical protein